MPDLGVGMVKAKSNGAGKSYGAKLDKVLQWDPMGLTNLNGCPPITHSAVMALIGNEWEPKLFLN